MKKVILLLAAVAISLGAMGVPQPVGTLHRDTLLGVPCQVYLPHNYQKRIDHAKRGFPVLYLQHGMFGNEDDWSKQGHLMLWMDSLLREEMVAEMIIVMPDNFLGSIPPVARAELMARPNIDPKGQAFDTEGGSRHWKKMTREEERAYEMSGYWEEHFPEFMTEVERKYWIDSREKHRAIAGLSMGGFHSMHVSHYLFGTFDYVGLFSPVVLPDDISISPAYANWEEDLEQMAQLPPLYWIAIGHDDFLYEQLRDYRHWLDAHHMEYVYYETTGGHNWNNWQNYLCRFLKACFTRHW